MTSAKPIAGASKYVFPLSFAQQRLWFFDQLVPGSASYNIITAVRVNVRLDVRAFSRAVNELVRRHESLRTTFGVVEGEPVQVVAPALTVRLEGWDLRGLPAAVREREVVRLATAAARRPFDLTRGPLLRVGVVWLGSSRYVVLVCMHHIVSDGWSMDVFSREVAVLYEAFAAGRPSPLPELEIQYPDFAVWQRQWLTGNVLESQLAYWRRALADLPSLELPTDRPRPKVQSHVGATSRFTVPAELRDAVAGLARGERATLFMALLAAFGVVLARTADQDDLVVGSPIANRNRAELENLIGFFVNTLVLRVDCSGEPSFLELLSRVREVALGAYAHQDLPFEKLVEELAPERDLGRNPLFQVTFQLFNAPGNGDRRAPATVEVDTGSIPFDLFVSLWEGPSGLSGRVEYSTDLFDAVTVESLVARYVAVLEGVVADPGCSVWRLPWLSAAERRAVVEAPNVTEVGVASGCVHEVFAMRAAAAADAVAVVGPGGQLSFGELERAANRLAWYLRDRGVRPGVVVGVCCERSCDLVVALLGVLKAGGAYLPLDPLYPVGRLEFMVADAAVPVVVTHRGLAGRLGLSGVAVVDLGADAGVLAEQSSAPVEVAVGGEDLAYVIYTSGSTGTPKGVMGTHGATMNRLSWMWDVFPFGAGEVACARTRVSFVDAVGEVFGALLAGVKLVLVPDEVGRDPAQFVSLLRREGVTRVVAVPSLLRIVLESPSALPGVRGVRYWVSSGEPLPVEVAARLRRACPGGRLLNLYGSTEVAGDATFYEVVGEPRGSSVPIGRPIANTRVYVLDRHRQPVPVGVAGELYVGGAGLARGYLNRPELTAERFVPDPFGAEPGGRLYRTGDRVRWLRDGNLEFLGRLDDQVKVRGFRVELGEIEAVLNAHPDVAESAVVAAPGPDGSQRLLGFVVVGDAAGEPAVEQLRGHLRERLPDYMVPSAILALDALPLNPNGKIDRKALAARDIDSSRPARATDAPVTPLEEAVTAAFSQVLGVDRVGVLDDFFALGGHSLLATRVISTLADRFGLDIPLAAIFENPTPQELARVVENLLIVDILESAPIERSAGSTDSTARND